jgi:hypothetical protein
MPPKMPMKSVMRRHRLTRADWNGYAVLMIIGGVVGVLGVFLPWANDYSAEDVNFSLSRPPGVAGVLHTQWGPPVLVAAIVVIVIAAVLIALGPRLLTVAAGVLVIVAGGVFIAEAIGATDSMAKMYRPGIGLYVTLLTGILLLPIGLVSVVVGQLLRRMGAATAPPGL